MFLRRYTATPPPPPRRRRLVARPPRPPRTAPAPAPVPADPVDSFNAPLHSLKAFVVATAIVLSTASASVAGVAAYLDVRDTAEFAARMRAWVAHSMPSLTAKIYRPADTLPDAAPSAATFDHDAAQQRLADAFDEGGFDAWAEAAARELEAETEVERARRRSY